MEPLRPAFPDLKVTKEIYWGDHGAKYLWGLRSVPKVNLLEDLGAGDLADTMPDLAAHGDLLESLGGVAAEPAARSHGLEELGGGEQQLLVVAVAQDPQATVATIVEAERRSLLSDVTSDDPSDTEELGAEEASLGEKEGERFAELLLALEETAEDENIGPVLLSAHSDEELLLSLHNAVAGRYEEAAESPQLEGLGAGDWIRDKLHGVGENVKRIAKLARSPKDSTLRAATLAALSRGRSPLMDNAKFFLGDIFEYAVRGREENAELSAAVERQLKLAAQERSATDPLVVVSHSFGAAIFYDLVTSDRFTENVDLWVTVGAQVPFFAEMRFFKSSPDPTDIPAGDPDNQRLSRPRSISKWINIYDPADVLSFIAEPVFDGVADIKMQDGAHVANAHSAYFGSSDFYDAIRGALRPAG